MSSGVCDSVVALSPRGGPSCRAPCARALVCPLPIRLRGRTAHSFPWLQHQPVVNAARGIPGRKENLT